MLYAGGDGGQWTVLRTLCVCGSWLYLFHVDAYPVHISNHYREWMAKEHPQLISVYVPASCTSAMQIVDVV